MPLREALHQTEKELIDQALIETEGNILQAAKCWVSLVKRFNIN